MCINIWIPVSIFTVTYEVGSGRPVTELDMLIMEAIDDGPEPTIEQLANLFHLPSRIIIEITITLARSNWITINPESGGFIITECGKDALKSGEPPKYLHVITQEETIVKECLLGQNCLFDKVFIKEPKNGDYLINAIIDSRIMSIEEVEPMLRVKRDQWIRFIDNPRLISRSDKGIRAEINIDEQRISFLPDSWKAKLEPLLLDRVAKLERNSSV